MAMIVTTGPDGKKRITTQKAENKKKSLGISSSGSSYGGKSGSTYYSYTDKDTGKQMSTSSKAVADARSAGSYTDNRGGSYKSGSVATDYGDSVRRAIESARILGNKLAPDFTDGTRLVYTDQYGYTHTTANPDIARMAAVGDIYKYFGPVTASGYVASAGGDPLMKVDPSTLGGSMFIPTATLGISTGPQSTLVPQVSSHDYFDKNFGGRENYIKSQQARYQQALATGNTDLINRLQADAARVGYTLSPQTTQNLIPQVPQQQQMPLYQIPKPPEYTPYKMREFVPERPNYSITSDSSDTTFIPTARAKDRWQQQEQFNAAQHHSQYSAERQNWADLQDIYWKQLMEQQRRQERAEDIGREDEALKRQADILAYEQAFARWTTAGKVLNEQDAAILGVPVGTLTSDQAYRDASVALEQAQLALSRAKTASGGGSGGSKTPSTLAERQAAALADAYDAVDKALGQGIAPEQVEQSIRDQAADLVRQTVDPEKVIDYLYSKAQPIMPETPANEGSWYTKLDRKLGGWLPFGAPR